MNVYLYQNNTEKILKNIYIGEYGWKPGENTLFYYEFENNFNDSSGKWNNITTTSWVWYTTQWWQYVANLTDGTGYIRIPSIQNSIGTWDFTVSFRLYPKQPWYYSWNSYPMIFWMTVDISPYPWPNIFFDPFSVNWLWDKVIWRTASNNQTGGSKTASSLYNWWHHFVMTRNSWTVACYIDWQQDVIWNSDTISFPTTNEYAYMWFALFAYNGNRQSWRNTWVMWDKLILESKWWSAQEVSDYYNQTKSNYWL